MRKQLLLIVLACCIVPAVAGNDNIPVGARSAAMGNASVTLSDIWSVQHNQAGLAKLKTIEAGIYSEQRYLNKQTMVNAAAVVVPTKLGVWSASFSRFGYSQYNESKYGLCYAREFGERFSAGLQFDYLHTFIGDNNGQRSNVTFEAGIQARLTKELLLGAHLYNPVRAKAADYNNERVPTIFRLGLQYTLSERVIFCAETEKDINAPAVFKAGIEYLVIKELYLRGGVSTQPVLGSFGFGLNLKQFKIDLSASFHQQLGYSPALGIRYTVKQDRKVNPATN